MSWIVGALRAFLRHWAWVVGFVLCFLFVGWAMAPIVAELVGAWR